MDASLKHREREARRAHILDAARRLFALQGFQGTTMDGVAKASAFTKRTVYAYFASKEELWCGVMARALEGLALRFEGVAEGAGSGMEGIMGMGAAFETFVGEDPEGFQVLSEGRSQPGVLAEGTRGLRELGEAHARMQGAMAGAIRQGTLDGSLRDDLDPEGTAALLALYATSVMAAVRQAGAKRCLAFDPGALMARSMDFLGHALRPPIRED
nr:helix-turn-helix domain-containing protein [uncultured Holophaga sp.]